MSSPPIPVSAGDGAFDPSVRWFQHAVFYEVLIRGYFDANNDGTGDLRGLREKFDYIEWLGIDCIWMLPFYPSPFRDGGYDISDFFNVHPDYGSIGDLVAFLEDAHRRGIRVVADLVMNHTSDEHPWFIESRSSRDNAKADWYVWNDDDQKWPDARVVFTDVERSNWTWDDTRQQYYWHRFYHHQPDLNYENPEVADTMIDLVRFWLDLGFDGFRLDAVPYLYQRDGTSGEHLPETHAFIKRVRKQIEADYPGRILLAEANGWPSDVADYFGDGDECHLCFHFPLMPRLFMAVRREQRYPITEILAQTPVINDACQWAIFLRNHDELTLEQVSEEERDYLIAEYAKDPRMKRHMGIGRRLAPLLDNDRRTAELLYALILSLPGSPVIYYGDELLMGDNIYLGDRDSVRTPMQWSPDRNGGFSKADFAQLYLPPLMDPVYGFSALNVEAQLRNQGSFLHWLRRMLTERRALPVMGVGEMEVLPCANPSVLAYVRSGEVADILSATTSTGPTVSPSVDARVGLGPLDGAGPDGSGRERERGRRGRVPPPGGPVRAQPEPVRPAGGARVGPVGRLDPVRGVGARALPGHHRGALPRSPCRPTGSCGSTSSPRRGRSRNDHGARPGSAHAGRGVAGAAAGRAGRAISPSSAPRCSWRAGPA